MRGEGRGEGRGKGRGEGIGGEGASEDGVVVRDIVGGIG